jgi:uncharacterized membrane protein
MPTFEESIEVNVPVRTAYNQWTQFEDFPRFMEGVEKIVQQDDTKLHWVVEIAGQTREWDATITEQEPDQRIAWRADGDVTNAGVVTFHKISDDTSKIMLQLDFEPEGFVEKAGTALGIVKGRVKADLGRFKEFIEAQGSETGAWRGEVEQNDVS